MSELVDCINALSAKDIIKSVAKTANGVPFYIQTSGLSGFCAEYQAVYDSLTTPPSAGIAAAQNTMWCALVDAGIAAKIDVFYLFAQTINTAGEALVNWKNPGTFDATAYNSPVFVALEGFTSDGISKYIDTNWNATVNGVNYTLNDCSMAGYVRTNVSEDRYICGIQDATTDIVRINPRKGGDTGEWWSNNATKEVVAAQADSRGMFVITRSAVNSRTGYRNKVVWGQDAVASVNVPDGNVFVLGQNLIGTGYNSITTRQVSLFFAGANLSLGEVTTLTDTIEVYMDSNGKGVI